MQLILLYFFKLSVSLGILYLFYQLLLRRMTFYNHNRWYLAGYSLLCFFIPFIDISPAFEKNEAWNSNFVSMIPVLENIAGNTSSAVDQGDWTVWTWLILVFVAGASVMLIRLVIQFISFSRIKRKARLIADEEVRFYQVDKNIIPFSFGKSIFINQELHTEAELKEIIRHEFVHVKQKHTIDIIWAEILCLLNWYNPFAWLIRKAIRQNLEFIADDRVLANGMDKKQYQYLLLKVIGNTHFSMGSQFNFSSLKNRIVMMNKMSTARIQLTRFLFVLPLLAVVLLSFRSATMSKNDIREAENSTVGERIPGTADYSDALMITKIAIADTTKPGRKKTEAKPVTPVSPPSPASPQSPVQSVQPASPVQPAQPKPNPTLEIINKPDPAAKPLIIVNGEHWPAGLDLSLMDADKIESMNVLKGESAAMYGDKGKHGVILITTKKDNVRTVVGYPARDNSKTVTGYSIRIKEPAKTVTGQLDNVLYIIDGKPATREVADKLEPSAIKSVDVLKDSKAEEKYGEKGKNGVIEIITNDPPKTKIAPKKPVPAWDIKGIEKNKREQDC